MNITFNYKDCANQELGEALEKLANFTGWKDPKDLLRFAKLESTFKRHAKTASVWYRKLVNKHCNLDFVKKDGKIVTDPKTGKPLTKPRWVPNPQANNQMDFDFRDKAAFEADYKILSNHEFTIKVYKWTTDELHAAGLNAKELKACAKMLSDADPDMLADLDDINEDTFEPPVDMDLTAPELPLPTEATAQPETNGAATL